MQIGTMAKSEVCRILWLVMASLSVVANGLCAAPPQQDNALTNDVQWEYIPLRTAEQKAKGYAGGEMGQVAFCLAVSPSDPRFLAVGIDTAAVYISTDGAKSWHSKRRGIMSNGVQSIAFDPKNPRVLWATGLRSAIWTPEGGVALSEQDLLKYSDPKADGIYRSVDGGENWQLLRNAVYLRRFEQNQYFAFDLDSFDGVECRTVYAGTHRDGLLKTSDAGKTWQVLGFPDTLITAVALHPFSNRLFVATYAGLFRSDDGGKSFDKAGLPNAPVYGLALNAKDTNVLYVALGKEGVWWSRDGGQTFTQRDKGLPDKHDWRVLAISPANPDNLYVKAHKTGNATTLCWSHDGGATWHPYEKWESGFFEHLHPASHATGLAAHPTEANTAFIAYPNVEKTEDGGRTWHYCSDGISGSRLGGRTSIAFRPDDPKKMVFFFIDFGSVLTTDGGDTFAYVPPRQFPWPGMRTMPVGAYDPRPGSRRLISAIGGYWPKRERPKKSGKWALGPDTVGWSNQFLCISEDDGANWTIQTDTEGNYEFLAFHPQKPDVVYAGRANDSLRSRDGGTTWQTLPHPIKAMFSGDGDLVFALRKLDQHGWASEVLKSSDQGETWTPLPGRITGGFVTEVDVDSHNPNRLYAAAHGGVWVFDGKGWTGRNERHGLGNDFLGRLSFMKVAVDPTRPNIVYAGQNHCWRGVAKGIFRSTDYGEHWQNITGNLSPDLTVWAITVSPHDGTVWLGTDYGNWKLSR